MPSKHMLKEFYAAFLVRFEDDCDAGADRAESIGRILCNITGVKSLSFARGTIGLTVKEVTDDPLDDYRVRKKMLDNLIFALTVEKERLDGAERMQAVFNQILFGLERDVGMTEWDEKLELLKKHMEALGPIEKLNGWLPWAYKTISDLRQEIAELKARRKPVGRTVPVVTEKE